MDGDYAELLTDLGLLSGHRAPSAEPVTASDDVWNQAYSEDVQSDDERQSSMLGDHVRPDKSIEQIQTLLVDDEQRQAEAWFPNFQNYVSAETTLAEDNIQEGSSPDASDGSELNTDCEQDAVLSLQGLRNTIVTVGNQSAQVVVDGTDQIRTS